MSDERKNEDIEETRDINLPTEESEHISDTSAFVSNEPRDAISAAVYIEQILASEHQWITHRLYWLFVSQSFCITAYVVLVTETGIRKGAENQQLFLSFSLPILGIVCSTVVGLSVRAGAKVSDRVLDERAKLTRYINEKFNTTIPLTGVKFREDELRKTYKIGALPGHLPWLLVLFWTVFLILEIISFIKNGNG